MKSAQGRTATHRGYAAVRRDATGGGGVTLASHTRAQAPSRRSCAVLRRARRSPRRCKRPVGPAADRALLMTARIADRVVAAAGTWMIAGHALYSLSQPTSPRSHRPLPHHEPLSPGQHQHDALEEFRLSWRYISFGFQLGRVEVITISIPGFIFNLINPLRTCRYSASSPPLEGCCAWFPSKSP